MPEKLGESPEQQPPRSKLFSLGEELSGDPTVDAVRNALGSETEPTLKAAEGILEEAADEEIQYMEQDLRELLDNPEAVQKLCDLFREKRGWGDGETRAMLGVLEHALVELNHGTTLVAPEETVKEAGPGGKRYPMPSGARGLAETLRWIIARDYNQDMASKAGDLIGRYVGAAEEKVQEYRQRGAPSSTANDSEAIEE